MTPSARYRLDRRLGTGGMATVWLARHRASDLPVALKVVASAATPGLRLALQNEVRVLARLDHPGIVEILDQGTLGPEDAALGPAGAPWLALGFAPGGDLEGVNLPWDALRPVLRDVLSALAAAHARGVLHLDVKPANLLRGADGRVRIADFGIARTLREARGFVGGSPGFMAPEQVDPRYGPFGPWTDLYALGVTARRICPDLPADARAWTEWLSAFSPSDRPISAADAAAALPGGTGPPTAPEPRDPRLEGTSAADEGPDDVAVPTLVPRVAIHVPRDPPAQEVRPLRHPELALVGLRDVGAIGRERELAALWALLVGAAADGTARVATLVGPPGAGAGHLARTFAVLAGEIGIYPVFDHLPAPSPGTSPYAALRARSGTRPWLVVLTHASADDERFAADVLAMQDVLPSPVVVVLTGAHDVAGATAIAVDPLGAPALERLLGEGLGVGPRLRAWLVERVGGLPGPAVGWVRAAWRDGKLSEAPYGVESAEIPTFEATEAPHAPEDEPVLARLAVADAAVRLEDWVWAGGTIESLERLLAAGTVHGGPAGYRIGHPGLAAALLPDDPLPHHRAWAARLADRPDLASRHRAARHRLACGDDAGVAEVVEAWLSLQEYGRAETLLASWPSTSCEARSLRARAAWQLKRLDAAVAHARAAIAASAGPSDAVAHAWRILGSVALNAGDPEALAFLERAIDAARSPAVRGRAWFVVGSLHYRRLALDAAEAAYQRALTEGAGNASVVADAENQLAELCRLRGRPAEGLAHLDRAVAAAGREQGSHALTRALLLRAAGRPTEAIAACAHAVERYLAQGARPPYHPWLCEGLSWQDLGDLPAARAALERGLERAAVSRRRRAAAGLHAFLLGPTSGLGDWTAAERHLDVAMELLGTGEADPDLVATLRIFRERAHAAARSDLAERAEPLWREQEAHGR